MVRVHTLFDLGPLLREGVVQLERIGWVGLVGEPTSDDDIARVQ